MHLCLVEIKNFRSFETLRVELQSGLNVLVGRNNTGKTNLLQAIRHAVGPSVGFRVQPDFLKYHLWKPQYDPSAWTVMSVQICCPSG